MQYRPACGCTAPAVAWAASCSSCRQPSGAPVGLGLLAQHQGGRCVHGELPLLSCRPTGSRQPSARLGKPCARYFPTSLILSVSLTAQQNLQMMFPSHLPRSSHFFSPFSAAVGCGGSLCPARPPRAGDSSTPCSRWHCRGRCHRSVRCLRLLGSQHVPLTQAARVCRGALI